MYPQPYAFQSTGSGEPTPEALHREEFLTHEHDNDAPAQDDLVEPADRMRARLIRAANAVGVGRFFA